MQIRGGCLCGAVTYEVQLPFEQFVNCHCSRCRKASGGAYAANALVTPAALRWTAGESEVRRFDLPTAESFSNCFCVRCGSPLPHATRSGRWMIIPAGSLNDDPGEWPSRHVHWQSRAAWELTSSDLPISD